MVNLDVLHEYPTTQLQAAFKRIDTELDRRKGAEKIKAKLLKMAREAGLKITIEEGDGDFMGEPVKYKNPDNALETWTGRGRKPNWLVEALAAGKRLEDYEVKPISEPPKGAPPPPLHPDFKDQKPHEKAQAKL